jgi:hypothetical protein
VQGRLFTAPDAADGAPGQCKGAEAERLPGRRADVDGCILAAVDG